MCILHEFKHIYNHTVTWNDKAHRRVKPSQAFVIIENDQLNVKQEKKVIEGHPSLDHPRT